MTSTDPLKPGDWLFEFPEHASPDGLPALPQGRSWRLTFSDEFNGSVIDADKWNVLDKSNYGAGNREDQCYVADQARVGNGWLELEAQPGELECGMNPDTGQTKYYFKSALITTRGHGGPLKFKFRHGYVEASVKQPKGNAFVGTVWLASPLDGSTPGWPHFGDISISEIVGGRPDLTHGQFLYPCDQSLSCRTIPSLYNLASRNPHGGSTNFGGQLTNDSYDSYTGEASKRFVRYGLWWEPHKLTWFVDGKPVRAFDGKQLISFTADGTPRLEKEVGKDLPEPNVPFEAILRYEHSIVLSLAIGGAKAQSHDYGYCGKETAGGYDACNHAAVFPASLEVDYVRVFQTE